MSFNNENCWTIKCIFKYDNVAPKSITICQMFRGNQCHSLFILLLPQNNLSFSLSWIIFIIKGKHHHDYLIVEFGSLWYPHHQCQQQAPDLFELQIPRTKTPMSMLQLNLDPLIPILPRLTRSVGFGWTPNSKNLISTDRQN